MRTWTILLLGLLPANLAALARQADSAVRLPTVEVTGSILPRLGPDVASGSSERASMVRSKTIESWRPRTLPDLLTRETGVSIYDDLGSPSKFTLVSRGFTSSPVVGLSQGLSVFLDGVPLNDPDAGQVNFDLVPLGHVDRVEVLRGTASLLGPYSLGGAVNLVTRDGSAPGGSAGLAAGSEGTWSASLSNGGAAGAYRYYAGGSYLRSDGWRQLTGSHQLNGLVNVGRTWPRSSLRLQAMAANGYAETAGSLPLSVYEVKPDSNLSSGDFEDITQVHLALSGLTAAGSGRASATVYFRWNEAERFNVNQVEDPDVRSFSTNRTLGANVEWQTARLRAGLGGSANDSRVKIHAERVDPGLTTDVQSPIARLDAFVLGDVTAGPVLVSGGLRFDLVQVPFHNRMDPARDTTSTFIHLSPRIGARLPLGTAASLYASAGQSFRPPALVELACADPDEPCPLPFALGDDPPLDPVVATTFEVGAEGRAGAVGYNASAFRTDVRDDIMLFPGSNIEAYFANIAKTRREGIELGAHAQMGNVSLYLNHAWTRATYQDGGFEIFSARTEDGGDNTVEVGDRMPLVPDHVTSFGGSWEATRNLTIGLNGKRTGSAFLRGDEANEEAPLDPYWLVSGRVGVALGGWSVQLIATNLLDATYASFGTFNVNQGAGGQVERFLTPGGPRSIQVEVRRRFGIQ